MRPEMDTTPRGLNHHLSDLRRCLWRGIVGVAVCTVLCLVLSEPILALLRVPIQRVLQPGQRLVVLSVHEYVLTQLRAAVAGGLLLASPWVLTQLWRFAAPGLYRREQRMCLLFVGAGSGFALTGVLLGYFVALPLVFTVLTHGLPPGVEAAYSVGHLFGFAVNTLLVCAAICETPIVVFLLA
ncbi:MAG: twin-arginine translocase subunit TatC, partial [Myxococcota bacterium]